MHKMVTSFAVGSEHCLIYEWGDGRLHRYPRIQNLSLWPILANIGMVGMLSNLFKEKNEFCRLPNEQPHLGKSCFTGFLFDDKSHGVPKHLLIVQVSQTCLFNREVDFAVLSRVCLIWRCRWQFLAPWQRARLDNGAYLSPWLGGSPITHTGEPHTSRDAKKTKKNIIITPVFLISLSHYPANSQTCKKQTSPAHLGSF